VGGDGGLKPALRLHYATSCCPPRTWSEDPWPGIAPGPAQRRQQTRWHLTGWTWRVTNPPCAPAPGWGFLPIFPAGPHAPVGRASARHRHRPGMQAGFPARHGSGPV